MQLELMPTIYHDYSQTKTSKFNFKVDIISAHIAGSMCQVIWPQIHTNPHVFKPFVYSHTYTYNLKWGKILEQKWCMMDVIASHKKVLYTFIISDQKTTITCIMKNSTKKKYAMNMAETEVLIRCLKYEWEILLKQFILSNTDQFEHLENKRAMTELISIIEIDGWR
jgi:hypothetical protein